MLQVRRFQVISGIFALHVASLSVDMGSAAFRRCSMYEHSMGLPTVVEKWGELDLTSHIHTAVATFMEETFKSTYLMIQEIMQCAWTSAQRKA